MFEMKVTRALYQRTAFLLVLVLLLAQGQLSTTTAHRGLRRFILRALRVNRGGQSGSSFSLAANDTLVESDDTTTNDTTTTSSRRRRRRGQSSNATDESESLLNSLWSRFVPKLESSQFLDRIAMVATSLLQREDSSLVEEEHLAVYNETFLHQLTPQSDLTRPGRYIHVVTTAALPWFTGTAVNPLLRAAYLHRRTQKINQHGNETNHDGVPQSWVILVIPWLELREDQEMLYGQVFPNTTAQEAYIRQWLRKEANMPDVADDLDIVFYPARYHTGLRSIFAMGDMMEQLDQDKMDVAILEEPEHVNWFRAPGDGWTQKFPYVVGIIHTNYREYASSHYSGLWTAPALAMISSAMVRAYCHKVVKLSDTLQTYAPEKECTSNVHGVRSEFIEEGIRRSQVARHRGTNSSFAARNHKIYFIGKLLWAKGLDRMLELQEYYRQYTGDYFPIDIYGSGPEEKDIQRAFHGRQRGQKAEADNLRDKAHRSIQELAQSQLAKLKETVPLRTFAEYRKDPVPATFPGRVDHATLKEGYTVFVNPSLSEVLCTTTFEALAMGKFAIIPYHPSNMFFLRFPNALIYRDPYEFVASVHWAMNHDPEPLTPDQVREFTWEAATDRLIHAASITHGEALERGKMTLRKLDERIAWFHNEIGKGATGDLLRKVFGAGPASEQVKYQMERNGQSDDSEEEEEASTDGLSFKFRRSAFAEAIKKSLGDFSTFGIQ